MCLVQVLVNPLPVDAVAPAVLGERLHVSGGFLELLQILLAVVNHHILVVYVVAGQQQSHGACEGQAAVRTVGGEFLVPHVGGHLAGQVARVGKRVQAKAVVADTHLLGGQADVLQAGVPFGHQREVAFDHSGFVLRADNLVGSQAAKFHEARVVHDALELPARLKELGRRVPVYLLRDDMPPAQRAEVALHTAPLLGRLGQVEVAGMLQVRSFVEMPLETAAQEAHVLLVQFGLVGLADEPVLLVDDGEVRQYLDCLYPAAVYRLILRARDGVEFGQLHLKGYRQVGVLREDAPVFHRQKRELVFKCRCFQYIPHALSSFRFLISREMRRRLSR